MPTNKMGKRRNNNNNNNNGVVNLQKRGHRNSSSQLALRCLIVSFFLIAIGLAVGSVSIRLRLPSAATSSSTSSSGDDYDNVNGDHSGPFFGWPAITTTTTTNNDNMNWKGYQPNRTIALVHVGKSGGLTLRKLTSLICRLSPAAKNMTEAEKQPCIDRKLRPYEILARQIHYYFHMHGYNAQQMEDATTYLFVFRHPVDRVISTYRYSHPANCNDKFQTNEKRVVGAARPWGCHILEPSRDPTTPEYRVYSKCFPSAAMELFAQSTMPPFVPFPSPSSFMAANDSDATTTFDTSNTAITTANNNTNSTAPLLPFELSHADQMACRSLARRMVRGNGATARASPHMYYNYHYYLERTLRKHPDKVVLGVRTEHEWEDIRALDVAIGGAGEFKHNYGKAISHGSEHYAPSPLSTQAYRKLCCVLEDEIANYRELLMRVANLNRTQKEEAMDMVRTKCGIDPDDSSLGAWRRDCRSRMDPLYRQKKAIRQYAASSLREEEGLTFEEQLQKRINVAKQIVRDHDATTSSRLSNGNTRRRDNNNHQ